MENLSESSCPAMYKSMYVFKHTHGGAEGEDGEGEREHSVLALPFQEPVLNGSFLFLSSYRWPCKCKSHCTGLWSEIFHPSVKSQHLDRVQRPCLGLPYLTLLGCSTGGL